MGEITFHSYLQSANLVKEPPLAATESTKEIESTTAPSPPEKVEKGEEPRKMSASQRSQIGPDTPPPDTAPRLPPKPGETARRCVRVIEKVKIKIVAHPNECNL